MKIRVLLSALATVIVSACVLSPMDPDGHLVEGVVISGGTGELGIGATLQLTAEVVGAPGAPRGVEWISSDSSVATVTQTGLVTGVAEGSVTITAASTANPAVIDELELQVTSCAAPEQVQGRIDGDVTWAVRSTGGCTDYVLSGTVTVNGTLTIEPGVRVLAQQDTGIQVNSSGRLVAVGTADQPILMRSSEEQPGRWRGIKITSTDINELTHVDIAYCGGSRWLDSDGAAACVLLRGGRVKLSHAVIRHSADYGLFVRNADDLLVDFANNQFLGNAIPAGMTLAQVASLDAASDFSASSTFPNQTEVVDVEAARLSGGASVKVDWPALKNGYPYRFSGRASIRAGLHIAPGVTVKFGHDAGLIVESGGYLSAVGTAAAPITLVADNDSPGRWRGIKITTSLVENELTHVDIAHAGMEWLDSDNGNANVLVRGGRVKLTHSTFRDSSDYGVYVNATGDSLEGFSNNRFSGNERPLGLQATQVAHLDGETDFSADPSNPNAREVVVVAAARMDGGPSVEQVWPALRDGYFYFFSGRTDIRTGVAIEPGARLQFTHEARLNVMPDGYLSAIGTESDPIVFRGDLDMAGRWGGLRYNSTNALNELRHVTISGGAATRYFDSDDGDAHVLVRSASLKMSHVTLGPIPTPTGTNNAHAVYCKSGTLTYSDLNFEGVPGDRQMSAGCVE